MKVLHSGSLNVKSGGPALSTYLSMKGLLMNDICAEIIMTPLKRNGELISRDICVHYTQEVLYPRLGYVKDLKTSLSNLGEFDLYHIQGLWEYLGHGLASYARKKNKPYLMTLRGMLYPQALEHSRLIKKVLLLLYQRSDLQKAACVQATCVEEMQHYRNLGFTNPVAVLPNPIDVDGVIERPIPLKEKIKIGYLGRIHPRKRVERLIYAFSQCREQLQNCELIIIGADDKNYEQFLKDEVERLQLVNVRFTGFLTGALKDETISSLSCLAVPSDFENFGNIVTEALVRGVPVIASKGMPWRELDEYKCGWWIDNDQETINATILEAVSLSNEERIAMGYNGKRLIADRYSVEVLGEKMKQLYSWILGEGEKPSFVYE